MATRYDGSAPLGQGGYGSVFLGEFEGRKVAVKRVEVYRLHNDNEEEALKQLDHPNIVKLFYCEKDNNFKYFYLELCDASLDQVFLHPTHPKKYKGPELPRYIDVFRQLASGLEHIHSKNLIHRDIKPQNVLISVRSTVQRNEITIKWADFGLSKPVNERGTCSLSDIRGTKIWFAPETVRLLRQSKKEDTYRGTIQSDIFAQGLVFGCLLLNGEHLYGCGETEIHDNLILKNPVNMQKINGELLKYYENDLLRKMLEDNPQKRITSKEVVKQLESINNMLTEKENELRRLCHRDSSSGLIEKMKDLIQLGIDVNAKDEKYGQNALHYLCWRNSNSNLIDAIQLLILEGIDVNAKSDNGQNALHYLCRLNSNPNLTDAIQLLIREGIDVNAKDWNGWNALHFLCCNNSNSNLIDTIRLLIQLGIDVNAKVNDGRNALHYLCCNNSNSNLIDAIRLFIQLGIDVNAKDNYGRNALHYLCANNSNSNLINAIRLFIQLGIDVNAKDIGERNALHFLCANNSNSNLIDAIPLFIQLRIPVVSGGHDARSIIRDNNRIKNKDEILKLLDEAALV